MVCFRELEGRHVDANEDAAKQAQIPLCFCWIILEVEYNCQKEPYNIGIAWCQCEQPDSATYSK